MSNTPYRPWMHSLLDRMKELYGKTDAKTISEALPDGAFFEIKGSVATASNLPASSNKVGDIYIVTEDGGEYIWVTSETYPNGYWEKLGSTDTAPLFCTFTKDGNNNWVCDKTGAQMGAARAANRSIIFVYGECAAEAVYYDDGTDSYYVAQMLSADSNEVTCYSVFMVEGYGPSVSSIQIKPITPGNVVSAIGDMSSAQTEQALNDLGGVGVFSQTFTDAEKLQARNNIGAEKSTRKVTVQGTTPIITPLSDSIYTCGEITSLTISGTLPTGPYVIRFTSGATATTTSIPADIIFLEPFAPAANTYYEINVDNNHAVAVGWPTT